MDRRDLTVTVYVAQNTKCHYIRIEETSRIEQLCKRRKRTKIICLTLMYSDSVKMLTLYHDLRNLRSGPYIVDENI